MSRGLERERGHVLSVYEEVIGSTIAQAASAGATTIYVDDPSDYPEDQGEITIGFYTYTYDAVDDDAHLTTDENDLSGTLHLTVGLFADVDETMRAYLSPRTSDRWATVRVDDRFEQAGGVLHARVPKHLYPNLPLGVRRADGEEQVTCRHDDGVDVWIVEDAPGQDPAVLARAVHIGNVFDDVAESDYTDLPNDGAPFVFSSYPDWMDGYNITEPGIYTGSLRFSNISNPTSPPGQLQIWLTGSPWGSMPASVDLPWDLPIPSNSPFILGTWAFGPDDLPVDVTDFSYNAIPSGAEVNVKIVIQRLLWAE